MTAYKTADMKEKVRQLATGDNEAQVPGLITRCKFALANGLAG